MTVIIYFFPGGAIYHPFRQLVRITPAFSLAMVISLSVSSASAFLLAFRRLRGFLFHKGTLAGGASSLPHPLPRRLSFSRNGPPPAPCRVKRPAWPPPCAGPQRK